MSNHIIRLLIDLIEIERENARDLRLIHRENLQLHNEIKEFRQENDQGQKILGRQINEEHKLLLTLEDAIEEIRAALIPELVTAVKLSDESGDNTMDVQVGVPRQLKVETFGASGNPTVPVGATAVNSSNTTDFSVDSGALTLTPTGAAGATTDVTATVDGVTSNLVSYTIAAAPVEPVASVVLTDVTPA